MYRMWLATALAAVATGARGDDVNWQPAAPAPLPAARPPVPVVVPVAAPPDATQWTPAAPPPSTPPVPVAPTPPVKPAVEVPEFRVIAPPTPPASPPPDFPPPAALPLAVPPRELLPPQLPTLAIPDVAVADDKPEPKAAPKSEPLPPPRPVPPDPAKPAAEPPPAVWIVNPAAAACLPDTRPVLEPAPNLPGNTLNGVPVRRKTFGSPPIRLSRDYALRDVFGYDLARVKTGPELGEMSAPVTDAGPTADDFFVETEYLLWWANRPRIPLLATTGDGTGQGFVGQTGTRPLLGPGTFGPLLRDGFRIRAGGWLDDCGGRGLDASFFFLGRRTERRSFDGLPTLTRPFFSPNFDAEFGEVVALPNLSTGSLLVEADSFLWGADANYRHALCRTCDRTTAWFAGYRHLNLTETLTITENITASGRLAPDPIGTTVVVRDRFRTHNRFHGGQVGWLSQRRSGRWELDLRASIALGVTAQTLDIDGFQQRTRPGQATETFRGGLLATGPNLGRFTANRFSVVPEATATLGYAVTPNFRLTAGYNFLYWSNVIRPGDQIDRVVDVSLVPNPPAGVPASGQNRPLPLFRQSDFWTHGLTLGAQLRW